MMVLVLFLGSPVRKSTWGSTVCAISGPPAQGPGGSSLHGAMRQRTGAANIDWKESYAWRNFDHPGRACRGVSEYAPPRGGERGDIIIASA